MAIQTNGHTGHPQWKHRVDLVLSTTGIKTFQVNPASTYLIGVSNTGADTFDLVGYQFSVEEDTADSLTRVEWKFETGITDTNYTNTAISGMAEIGINITATLGAAVIQMEITELPQSMQGPRRVN